MRQVLGVGCGAIGGWCLGQLLLSLSDRIMPRSPEYGMPSLVPMFLFWSTMGLAVALGLLLGYSAGSRGLSHQQHGTMPSVRMGRWSWATAVLLAAPLLSISLVYPLICYVDRTFQSRRWNEQHQVKVQELQKMLMVWPNDLAATREETMLEALSETTLTENEFAKGTNSWGEKEWRRLAQLAVQSPQRLVGYDRFLWDKLREDSTSASLRDELVIASFEIHLCQNAMSDYWRQLSTLEDGKELCSQLVLRKIERENSRDLAEPPWWLLHDLPLDALQKLDAHRQELLPYLLQVLKLMPEKVVSESHSRQIQRIQKITRDWQIPH